MEWILCTLAGAIAGFIKSYVSHHSRIRLPERHDNYFIMGFFGDVLGGGFVGLLTSNPLIFSFFGLSSANWAFSALCGFAWLTILETLINRYSPPNSNKNYCIPLIPLL